MVTDAAKMPGAGAVDETTFDRAKYDEELAKIEVPKDEDYSPESNFLTHQGHDKAVEEMRKKRKSDWADLYIMAMRFIWVMATGEGVNALKRSTNRFLNDASMSAGALMEAAAGEKEERVAYTDDDVKVMQDYESKINRAQALAKMDAGADAATGTDPDALQKMIQELTEAGRFTPTV